MTDNNWFNFEESELLSDYDTKEFIILQPVPLNPEPSKLSQQLIKVELDGDNEHQVDSVPAKGKAGTCNTTVEQVIEDETWPDDIDKPEDVTNLDTSIDRLEMYICPYCIYETSTTTLLYSHVSRLHSIDGNFACALCYFLVSDKTTFACHMTLIHDKRYPRPVCDYRGTYLGDVDGHVTLRHLREQSVACEFCEENLTDESGLSAHVKGDLNKCKVFVREQENLEHIPRESQYNFCDFKTVGSKVLLHHEKHERFEEDLEELDLSHTQQSDYVAGKHSGLRLHFDKRQASDSKLECEQCDYRGASASDIKSHVDIKHSKRELSCKECDFKAIESRRLRVHERTVHHRDKLEKCQYCDFQCAFGGSLKRHVNSRHTRERLFQCPHCQHQATDTSLLRRHVKARHKDVATE